MVDKPRGLEHLRAIGAEIQARAAKTPRPTNVERFAELTPDDIKEGQYAALVDLEPEIRSCVIANFKASAWGKSKKTGTLEEAVFQCEIIPAATGINVLIQPKGGMENRIVEKTYTSKKTGKTTTYKCKYGNVYGSMGEKKYTGTVSGIVDENVFSLTASQVEALKKKYLENFKNWLRSKGITVK